MIIIIVFFYIFTKRNIYFRQSFYVGGNLYAAKLAGMKTKNIILFNFVLVSLVVAIGSILRASNVGATSFTSGGTSLSLLIITGVILGGADLKGGRGSIIGTTLAIFLLTIITYGLIIIGVSPFYADMFIGLILLGSALLESYRYKLIKK